MSPNCYFDTNPEFQEQPDWIDRVRHRAIEPIDHVIDHPDVDPLRNAPIKPLQQARSGVCGRVPASMAGLLRAGHRIGQALVEPLSMCSTPTSAGSRTWANPRAYAARGRIMAELGSR